MISGKTFKFNNYKFVTNIIFVTLFVLGIFTNSSIALAQSSMSGGDYSLNGGITVFTGQGTGGTYVNNPSSDPITGSASGGSYNLEPTPYNGSLTPTPNNNVSNNSVSATRSGYTSTTTFGTISPIDQNNNQENINNNPGNTNNQKPPRQNNNNNNNNFQASEPVLEIGEIPGVEWVDTGKGVDTNLDGIIDFISNIFKPVFNDGTKPALSSPERERELSESGISIKDYSKTLSTLEMTFILFAFILCLIVPVVRQKNPRKVSYVPLIIFIDYIIAAHKGYEISGISVHNFERNKDAESENYYFNIHIIDAFILPILFVLASVYIWPISWVASILILSPILARIYIGRRLLTRI